MSDTPVDEAGSASSAEVLGIDDDAGVRVLTFQRPEVMNAFNQHLWYALVDALEAAACDDTVRCVVLTGQGQRAFTAGQDLGEMLDPAAFEERPPGYQVLMPVVEAFPKPLLAAVNGVAVGIGLTLLPHCDLVLVGESARMKAPFIGLGVTTEASASVLLPATMGWQRAAELLYTQRWLPAHEAVEAGLALRVVPDDDVLEETLTLARQIAEAPLGPLMATKQLLQAGRADAVAAARVRELAAFEHLVAALLAEGQKS